MKKEYDFSDAERGKFYRENIKINLPIYLDSENQEFIKSIASRKKSDLSKVVNDLIRNNIRIAKVLK
ncbi:MAG: hypothetical protein JXR46_05970 [Calditrichaceae bacterium]|nr:hypothetical protein [Calditrichaceae bacterium]MBN2708572.1 hypothetical protein [Calditrichaceae bacterium]RQV96881.1 MAG: hypothetical protein EH224_03235 [Calditrichota bacterium]